VSLHLGARRSAPAFLKSEIHNGKSPLRQQRPPLRLIVLYATAPMWDLSHS
jgi:hypothetical protein